MPFIQSLLNELTRINHKKGLENVIILRDTGKILADRILCQVREKEIPESNIIVIGDETVVKDEVFNFLRDRGNIRENAFFAGIQKPDNFDGNSHIRILDMIRLSFGLAFGSSDNIEHPFVDMKCYDERIFLFVPIAEPLDIEILKNMYEYQKQAIIAA